MGGDPYFSHLSSPPPPGSPIFTLHTPSFFGKHDFNDKFIFSFLSFNSYGKTGVSNEKNSFSQIDHLLHRLCSSWYTVYEIHPVKPSVMMISHMVCKNHQHHRNNHQMVQAVRITLMLVYDNRDMDVVFVSFGFSSQLIQSHHPLLSLCSIMDGVQFFRFTIKNG